MKQITSKMNERGSHNIRVATIENGNPEQIQKHSRVKLVLRAQSEFGYGNFRWFGVDPETSILLPIEDLWAETVAEAEDVFRAAYHPPQIWQAKASWL